MNSGRLLRQRIAHWPTSRCRGTASFCVRSNTPKVILPKNNVVKHLNTSVFVIIVRALPGGCGTPKSRFLFIHYTPYPMARQATHLSVHGPPFSTERRVQVGLLLTENRHSCALNGGIRTAVSWQIQVFNRPSSRR